MTTLEAVNYICRRVGLASVSALETGTTSPAGEIEAILDETRREVCEMGWQFNRRSNVTVAPTSIQTIGTSPVTVHLSECVYQQSHPMVLDGSVQLMPTMNLTYGNLDSTLSPLFYLCPEGGNPTQMANDIADAIGAAKAAGRRVIMQVIDSARIWTTYSDAPAIWGSTHGELTSADLITAIHNGVFDYSTESARITSICAAIIARLDSDWDGARPDGMYHDIETGPTDGVLGQLVTVYGSVQAALSLSAIAGDATPVVGMQARITAKLADGCPTGGRSFSVVSNAFAYDAVMREIIYNTIVAEWTALGFTCPHYLWATPTASSASHGYTDQGAVNQYACDVDAGSMYYFSSLDVASLATDLAARDATKPFAPHLSLPRGSPYADLATVNTMLETCRDAGVADVFLFVHATTDATENALISGYLSSISTGIEYAITPESGRVESDTGNIFLSDVSDNPVLKVGTHGSDANRTVVMYGDRLFDRDENTDLFTGSLDLWHTDLIDFANIPPLIQSYITAQTALVYNEAHGVPQRTATLARNALLALIRARQYDSQTGGLNVLDSDHVRGVTGNRNDYEGMAGGF